MENLFTYINEQEVVQVARTMVRIPSITGREGDGMLGYIRNWFGGLRIPVREYPRDEVRGNFFADYGATSGPGRFVFNGHQDTKPVEGMTFDPFKGEIRNGRMYGRGACDMKGGIAAILCAFKALVRAGVKPKGGITFFSDIEEELGSANSGINWALKNGMLDGFEGLISAEPSGLEVHIGNLGAYVTAFETRGKSAHSGLAHLGVNAVMNMCRFITEYLELPYLTVHNAYFGKSTVNFEYIQGGLYLSAVPDHCVACLDSRLIPETPPEMAREQVHGLMKRLNDEHGAAVREIAPPPGWRPSGGFSKAEYIPLDHELVKRAACAVVKATGADAVIGGCPAATLAGIMIGRGTPAVICGPGSIAQAHTADEWVEVEQIAKAARIYTALMAEM